MTGKKQFFIPVRELIISILIRWNIPKGFTNIGAGIFQRSGFSYWPDRLLRASKETQRLYGHLILPLLLPLSKIKFPKQSMRAFPVFLTGLLILAVIFQGFIWKVFPIGPCLHIVNFLPVGFSLVFLAPFSEFMVKANALFFQITGMHTRKVSC